MTGEVLYHLSADQSGERLDRFIGRSCPGLTRTRAQRLIREGHVSVNLVPARAATRLAAGDEVLVRVPPPPPGQPEPEPIPLNIIYEDSCLLVIDKPAGLTVHPAAGHRRHTLVNALLAHLESLPDSTDPLRPGLVHRLDKDTSGLLLVAKTHLAHRELVEQFRSRTVKKVYLVLVKGRLEPAEGVIEAPVGRDPAHRQRMAVVPPSRGRLARTGYRVARYLPHHTLLEVIPETGRTHQIRVHLAAIGHPVEGDATYGPPSSVLSRQFLHAARLSFRHPESSRELTFESPLPPDLAAALEALG